MVVGRHFLRMGILYGKKGGRFFRYQARPYWSDAVAIEIGGIVTARACHSSAGFPACSKGLSTSKRLGQASLAPHPSLQLTSREKVLLW